MVSACPAARCVFTGQREREAGFSVSPRDGRSHRGLRPCDPTASRRPRLLLRSPGGQGVSTRTGEGGADSQPVPCAAFSECTRLWRKHACPDDLELSPRLTCRGRPPRPCSRREGLQQGSVSDLGSVTLALCLRTGSSFSRRPRPRDCGRRLVTVSVSGTCRTGGLACPERPGKPREAIPLGGWTHGHSRRGDGTSGDVSSARGAPEKHDRDCPSPKRVPPATPGLLGLTPPAGRAPASGLSPPGVLVLNFPGTTDAPRESAAHVREPGLLPPDSRGRGCRREGLSAKDHIPRPGPRPGGRTARPALGGQTQGREGRGSRSHDKDKEKGKQCRRRGTREAERASAARPATPCPGRTVSCGPEATWGLRVSASWAGTP